MPDADDIGDSLELTRRGPVLHVTLNRPRQLNVTTHAMNRALTTIFRDAGWDNDVRVIVLSGAGRAFCAGGDLFEPGKFDGNNLEQEMHTHAALLNAMVSTPKPIIAGVNGDAVGWGATLALFCDIVLAADSARFLDPHVNIGLSTGDGGAVIWPELIGLPKAKYFLLTGDPVTAAQADALGLISECVPAAALPARVEEVAARIAALPALAVRNTKRSVNIRLSDLVHRMTDTCIAYELETDRDPEHVALREAMLAERRAKVAAQLGS